MRNIVITTVALLAFFLLPLPSDGSLSGWLSGVGGVLSFSGCLAIALLLERFRNSGYLTISKDLVFWLNFLILVIGIWSLVHSLLESSLHIVIWKLITGFISVYLAWNLYKEKGSLKVIFSEKEVKQLSDVSQEIQKQALIGFWWVDAESKEVKWSSGMYDIYDKERGWNISLSEVESMVHPDDIETYKEVRLIIKNGISKTIIFRLNTSRGIRYIKECAFGSYAKGKLIETFGYTQDVTEQVLKEQAQEIKLNGLITELQVLKNERAVDSFVKKANK